LVSLRTRPGGSTGTGTGTGKLTADGFFAQLDGVAGRDRRP
jgi:hypothetical protein